MNDNLLSPNLPVSTRMMTRGYTTDTIDAKKLQSMDFKALDMGEEEYRKKTKHHLKSQARAADTFQLPDIATNNKVVSVDVLPDILEPIV